MTPHTQFIGSISIVASLKQEQTRCGHIARLCSEVILIQHIYASYVSYSSYSHMPTICASWKATFKAAHHLFTYEPSEIACFVMLIQIVSYLSHGHGFTHMDAFNICSDGRRKTYVLPGDAKFIQKPGPIPATPCKIWFTGHPARPVSSRGQPAYAEINVITLPEPVISPVASVRAHRKARRTRIGAQWSVPGHELCISTVTPCDALK